MFRKRLKPPTLRKGPVKHSKRVLDRIKAAGTLVRAIETHKAGVVEGFRIKYGGRLRDGETAPDIALALELAGRKVEAALGELVRADNLYCKRASERKILTEACALVARDETYPELVDVRRSIEMRYGREGGRAVHRMAGNTLRKPRRQLPQLEKVVVALREWLEKEGLPPEVRPAPIGELRGWLDRLEPGYDKLTAMLARLDDLEVYEEALRKDRDFELEAFDVDYGEALEFARAVFRLSGRAAKVIRGLVPAVARRRLGRKARGESEARAEGRRETPGTPAESAEE